MMKGAYLFFKVVKGKYPEIAIHYVCTNKVMVWIPCVAYWPTIHIQARPTFFFPQTCRITACHFI